ncbi:MAG TPA: translation initiation factor IF-3 [Candidatus Babeliales bacterium]|nr:translation initiation factor IF-3 [Candidatus Babeliales bacterium]
MKNKVNLPQINERILATQLQLITDAGDNIGVVTKERALQLAHDAGMDLVLIANEGADGVPVAKLMDFGKVIYAKKKKMSEGKKKQKVVKVKELKLRPKISDHDFSTKLNQGVGFLKSGMRLKITVQFRGRENSNRNELGAHMFNKIDQMLKDNPNIPHAALMMEKDSSPGQFWSRVYYLK